eukprot:m.81649 g.81649  ORF g.81649 m.81649 type:complete len:324 (-) comp19489_c0_seq1:63-1034(-)
MAILGTGLASVGSEIPTGEEAEHCLGRERLAGARLSRHQQQLRRLGHSIDCTQRHHKEVGRLQCSIEVPAHHRGSVLLCPRFKRVDRNQCGASVCVRSVEVELCPERGDHGEFGEWMQRDEVLGSFDLGVRVDDSITRTCSRGFVVGRWLGAEFGTSATFALCVVGGEWTTGERRRQGGGVAVGPGLRHCDNPASPPRLPASGSLPLGNRRRVPSGGPRSGRVCLPVHFSISRETTTGTECARCDTGEFFRTAGGTGPVAGMRAGTSIGMGRWLGMNLKEVWDQRPRGTCVQSTDMRAEGSSPRSPKQKPGLICWSPIFGQGN